MASRLPFDRLLLLVPLLLPLSLHAQTAAETVSAAQAPVATTVERQLLASLHQINLTEIEAGRLASLRGRSAATKKLAGDLISDHSNSDDRALSLGKSLNVMVLTPEPADLRRAADGKTALEGLKTLQGDEFDRAFARLVADDHRQAVEVVRNAQPRIVSPALSDFLDQVLPMLERQRDAAMALSALSSR
jgi:putative membrane protein